VIDMIVAPNWQIHSSMEHTQSPRIGREPNQWPYVTVQKSVPNSRACKSIPMNSLACNPLNHTSQFADPPGLLIQPMAPPIQEA
jgi:hypothetical protein